MTKKDTDQSSAYDRMDEEHKEFLENQEIASDMLPILLSLDVFSARHDIDNLKRLVGKMSQDVGFLEAWPFPETMRKAEIMKAQVETFRQFVSLLEARREQFKIQNKEDETPGNGVLKHMGLS
jgi:hypothetical protein